METRCRGALASITHAILSENAVPRVYGMYTLAHILVAATKAAPDLPKPLSAQLHVPDSPGLGYSAEFNTSCKSGRGSYKASIFDALECDVPALAAPVWKKGSRILDVGAGRGVFDTYLEKKYNVEIVCIDIVPSDCVRGLNNWASTKCKGSQGSSQFNSSRTPGSEYTPHKVGIFDGRTLTGHADASYDTVLFNSVLHHAAEKAPGLLAEAARVSRRWIVVNEDLDAQFVRRRNFLHDRKGVFRTRQMWIKLLTRSPAWELVLDIPIGDPFVPCPPPYTNFGHLGCRALFQRVFVARRRAPPSGIES